MKKMKPQKYKRLQGADWDLVKANFELLYTYRSDNGNIKGIYTNGTNKVAHWMDEEEKKAYLEKERKEK